jgi:hypothetical protein
MFRIDFKRFKESVAFADVFRLLRWKSSAVQAGRLRGPCPLCGGSEKSQRFSVDLDGKKWFCLKCKKGGNHLDLYLQAKDLSLYDGATDLAAALGMRLPEEGGTEKRYSVS